MTETSNKSSGRTLLDRAGSFLKGKRNWLEVTGYHIGDIDSDRPVFVSATAAVAGDIYAPRITIAGLLYGFVVARETVIEAKGQVWGDIYTGAFQLEPGGKLHGWVSTVDEDGYLLLRSGDHSTLAAAATKPPVLPPELEASGIGRNIEAGADSDDSRVTILRRLQAEAAAALMARAELEQTFDERVAEVAGETLAEAVALREEVLLAKGEALSRQKWLDEAQVALRLREEQVTTQEDELGNLRSLLSERSDSLAELEEAYHNQRKDLSQVEERNNQLKEQFDERSAQVEKLMERVKGLESALQASLQRAAEQEESLVRWQELADATEARADELEEELNAVRLQLDTSTGAAELLREQREKVQNAWEKASVELEELQQRLASQPDVGEGSVSELMAASQRIAELENRLLEVEAESQEHYDQLLWYKASLETTCRELDQTRQEMNEQAATVEQLRTEVKEKQSRVEKWKTNIGRMTELLYEAEQRIKTLRDQQSSLVAEVEAKATLSRHRQLQLESNEAEMDRYHQQLDEQGRRLAEAQANLIEREVELERMKRLATQQKRDVDNVKQAADKRIRSLEEQLARTQQKLQTIVEWVERRHKRGEGE